MRFRPCPPTHPPDSGCARAPTAPPRPRARAGPRAVKVWRAEPASYEGLASYGVLPSEWAGDDLVGAGPPRGRQSFGICRGCWNARGPGAWRAEPRPLPCGCVCLALCTSDPQANWTHGRRSPARSSPRARASRGSGEVLELLKRVWLRATPDSIAGISKPRSGSPPRHLRVDRELAERYGAALGRLERWLRDS